MQALLAGGLAEAVDWSTTGSFCSTATEEGVVLSGTWVQGTAVAPSLLTDQTRSSPHSEILSSVVSALGLI